MLNEVKLLANECDQQLLSCSAQILRCRSEPALSVAEGMTGGAQGRHETQSHADEIAIVWSVALVPVTCYTHPEFNQR